MRIISATAYALKVPFVERFSHSLFERDRAESVVVKLETDAGVAGYGEGAPRRYVTGETLSAALERVSSVLLPVVIGVEVDARDLHGTFAFTDALVAGGEANGVVYNAARCAVEVAVVDCMLRARSASLAHLLPPRRREVVYSGVIGAGSTAKTEAMAMHFAAVGFRHVKMKVTGPDDIERLARVREIVGPGVSIRVDANGAFTAHEATAFARSAAQYDVACIEQPLPRGDVRALADVRLHSPIPVMVDESVVTTGDAVELIEERACDLFNLRISKCGGLSRTLALARLAASSGMGVQLGCQVGESAILSAAGRHLAAHLESPAFVEGSYGTHLLVEDVARDAVMFGSSGKAGLLSGPGLGIDVLDGRLAAYADRVVLVR
jgi:L-alanine-DL-glutamate epimerase-like enolase superfamily enzyme